jgi:mono/diheme cytochrome c family protein
MKKILVIAFLIVSIAGCSDVKRTPGAVYMPDMAYSRAIETFSELDSTQFSTDSNHTDDRIFYNSLPVAGTIARGEELPFPYAKDAPGDTTNYVASKQVVNPLPPLNNAQMTEAARLYLINCAICHGPKLDGNGPLYKGGEGPFPAKPATLVGDVKYESMPEGQMFYSITYGKNLMGSYASQLNRTERWMVIHYIKAEQAKAKGGSASGTDSTSAASNAPAATDSTGTAK